ncbi:MAG: hypothetical protein ABIG42_08515 [bacterium]
MKRYTPWALALFFGVIYLLTPTALYYWDGIVFASLCEEGTPHQLLHPHHLLYNLILDIIYEILHLHLPNLRALPFLIWVSSIFGALTIYFSHLIFRTIFNREGLAAATTSFMGFSFTFWHFSTDANAYIISAFFPILAAYLMISMNDAVKPRIRMLWACLSFTIGMLLHQVVVFFYPVYFFWLLAFRYKDKNLKKSIPARLVLLVLPGLMVGITYFLMGRIFFQFETFDEYFGWTTAYGHQARWWFGSKNSGFYPFIKAVGLSHLSLMFYPDYIRFGLFNFDNLSFEDIIKKFVALVSILTVILVFVRGLIYLVGAVGRRRFYAALLLIWIIPYVAFFTFFTPQFEFYRLYYLFPLMVIFALGLKGFFEKPTFEHLDLPISPNTLSGWVLILFLIFAVYNGALGIHPQMFPANNPWLNDATTFANGTPANAVMVVPWSDENMEEYSRVANLVSYFGTQGVLFAEPVESIMGPMPEIVGPPPVLDDVIQPVAWDKIEVRPGLNPKIELSYFHEDMLDGRFEGWHLFQYQFPDTKIPIEGTVRLPDASQCRTEQFGRIKYQRGVDEYLILDKEDNFQWQQDLLEFL